MQALKIRINVISCIFLDHDAIKLEIDSKRNYTNTWRLNKEWVTEIREENKNFLESMETEAQLTRLFKVYLKQFFLSLF